MLCKFVFASFLIYFTFFLILLYTGKSASHRSATEHFAQIHLCIYVYMYFHRIFVCTYNRHLVFLSLPAICVFVLFIFERNIYIIKTTKVKRSLNTNVSF